MAKLHREHASLVSDNQGKIPKLEIDVVGALEVVVYRNLFFRVGLVVPQLEDGVLGMSTLITGLPGELLDRVGLVICQIMSDNLKNASKTSTYHRPCLYASHGT